MVGEKADDVKRANIFAEEYNEMLETWVNSRVVDFTMNIRTQVRKEMPNAEGAAARAYNASFERGNYRDVLEYCLDVNAYLKKLFTQIFDKQKQAAIDQHESDLRDEVSSVYKTIGESVEQWQTSLGLGPSQSTGKIQLYDFKAFLQRRADDSSQPASIRSYRMAAVTNFPEVSNFPIAGAEIFSKAFRKQILNCLSAAAKALDDKIAKHMDQQRRT